MSPKSSVCALRRIGYIMLLCGLLSQGCAAAPHAPLTAIDELHRRLEQDASNVQLYLELSDHYLQNQEYLRAKQYLVLGERVFRMTQTPQQNRSAIEQRLFRLGVTVAIHSQQYSDAISRCESQLRKRDDQPTRELLAALYIAIGDNKAGELHRRILVEQSPSEKRYILALAKFYDSSEDPDKRARAPELFERYLQLESDVDSASAVRAHLLARKLTTNSNAGGQP